MTGFPGVKSALSMPDSAVPDWALTAPPSTENIFLTFVLLLIQTVGLVGFGRGIWLIILYHKPNDSRAPPGLSKPILMVVVGLFDMVPMRVYDLTMVTLEQVGWL